MMHGPINIKYSNMVHRLPLSLTNCHIKSDFDQKSSSTQFEGNGKIWRTYKGADKSLARPWKEKTTATKTYNGIPRLMA